MLNKQIKKYIISLAAMLAITIALIAVSYYVKNNNKSYSEESLNEYVRYDFVMGTAMTTTLYRDDSKKNIKNAAEKAYEYVDLLDKDVISWRSETSEVYALNKDSKSMEDYSISADLYKIASKSLMLCADSEGALDITLRPLANVWNIENYDSSKDGEFELPKDTDLEKASNIIGYEHVFCNQAQDVAGICNLSFDKDGITLDFGAVGKGTALDGIYDIIKEDENVCGGVVAVGGSILVYGSKDDGSGFSIGIRDPKGGENETLGYIKVSGMKQDDSDRAEETSGTDKSDKCCISTSGSYEKYVDFNGKRYHHIMDRNTLAPAESDLLSVTIYCEDGLYSDGLSTACFVLGKDKSEKLLEKYDAEAVFVSKDGKVSVTEGLTDKFVLTSDDYLLE